jgi:hypothetical protein
VLHDEFGRSASTIVEMSWWVSAADRERYDGSMPNASCSNAFVAHIVL